jgi:hypothetical protein
MIAESALVEVPEIGSRPPAERAVLPVQASGIPETFQTRERQSN